MLSNIPHFFFANPLDTDREYVVYFNRSKEKLYRGMEQG